MAFSDEIKELCTRAIESGQDVFVKLPRPPSRYTPHMIEERFFQLYHLIKRNGCTIEKVNLTDYKIFKSIEPYIDPRTKNKK